MTSSLLSVVICTHNRPADLRRCLTAVAGLEDPVEVIVVDSASDPPCRTLVGRFRPAIASLRYVREEEPGLSRARNRGVSEASSDLVAFIDDDASPHPDWARRIAAPFSEASVGCVGGACLPAFPDCERPSWLSDQLLQFAGITRFREARAARSRAEWPFGANMAFRREALERVGGFPETLGRIESQLLSGEESAVIEAIEAAGWTIMLHPDAEVDHTVPASRCDPGYYWRRLWWAGVTKARLRGRSIETVGRMLAAAPVRLLLYGATWDRVHLYRLAETAGYFHDAFGPRTAIR